ncbi:hypothetical protein LCGC14_0194490 [marine sediment metagenome]|uniref:ArnR1-like winged helix-turn-helix domain-containing protein n=1 Tax=marine sediment metagenome TaxID=412755 RepID=A0A0F9V1M0_9ZZZZ
MSSHSKNQMQSIKVIRYGIRDVILIILGENKVPLFKPQLLYQMNHYDLSFIPDENKINAILQKLAKQGLLAYTLIGNSYGVTLTKKGETEYNIIQ